MTAQQNSRQLVTVAGKTVEKLEYQGRAVVTLSMIDEIHGRPSGTARRAFAANKKQFSESLDYIHIKSLDEIRTTGLVPQPNGVNVLTESGYLKLVKTFTDDLAWQVQGQLVECYFRVKQQTPAIPNDPIIAMLNVMQTMRQDQIALTAQQQVITTGLTETRKEVADLKANIKLENWQQANTLKAVNHKVELWREMFPALNSRKAYPAIYRFLKDKFRVPRYNEIPAAEYDKAISTVRNLNLNQLAGL